MTRTTEKYNSIVHTKKSFIVIKMFFEITDETFFFFLRINNWHRKKAEEKNKTKRNGVVSFPHFF